MLKRFFHWFCDNCNKEELKESHGFPEGFRHFSTNKTIHLCKNCQTNEIVLNLTGKPLSFFNRK